MSTQYGQTSTHERLRSVREFGAPLQIWTGFASCLPYCSNIAHRRLTKLCTMFGCLLGWYNIYIFFQGLLPCNGILQSAKFTLRPSLAFCYIGSITPRPSSSGREPNFAAWYKKWTKELSHRAPPIFSRAAITLGIGPHSSTSPEHDLQNTDISFITFKKCRSIKVHKSLNS